jgi:hypothetical protein
LIRRSNQRARWTKRGAFEGRANVRAAPFDAIELELGALDLTGLVGETGNSS